MKIYVSSCNPMLAYRIDQLHDWAVLAQPQIHTFTDSPAEADIILVPDILFAYEQQREFLYKFLHKCYAVDPELILPGLYASAMTSALFCRRRLRGSSYLFNRHHQNIFLNYSAPKPEKEYLATLIGGATSWVRKRLFTLDFHRDDILIQCTTGTYNHWSDEQSNREAFQKSYIDTIRKSKFVLCPRGIGTNSIRLFEVMELGVAPIILSDAWLPPQGIDWKSFAIFMKESEIERIPEIAERHVAEYAERGRLARKAWESYFSDPYSFNRSIEDIVDLQKSRTLILDKIILALCPFIQWKKGFIWKIREFLKVCLLFVFRLFSLKFPYKLERD
jgi:hypothetical protein